MAWSDTAARAFVFGHGRLLEQRVFAVLFDGGRSEDVLTAVMAFQNADGGFGNGLEPDKRVPFSQPLDVEIAFEWLAMVGADAREQATRACDWLETVAEPSGAVPILLPSIDGYPRAPHFQALEYPPGVNPTAPIAGHAHALGVDHPWVERATKFCLSEIDAGRVPGEAHDLLGLTKLLEHLPDRQRAERAAEAIAAAVPGSTFMTMDADSDSYGVTPLEFAPTPDSLARPWFDDAVIDAHLDRLERDQQDDGGWPLSWEPPTEASRCEWRAFRTVLAVHRLKAYGR